MTLELFSWRTGKTWSLWHLSYGHQKPLCGVSVSEHAITCTASGTSGPKLLEDLCRPCLAVFAKEPPEAA